MHRFLCVTIFTRKFIRIFRFFVCLMNAPVHQCTAHRWWKLKLRFNNKFELNRGRHSKKKKKIFYFWLLFNEFENKFKENGLIKRPFKRLLQNWNMKHDFCLWMTFHLSKTFLQFSWEFLLSCDFAVFF